MERDVAITDLRATSGIASNYLCQAVPLNLSRVTSLGQLFSSSNKTLLSFQKQGFLYFPKFTLLIIQATDSVKDTTQASNTKRAKRLKWHAQYGNNVLGDPVNLLKQSTSLLVNAIFTLHFFCLSVESVEETSVESTKHYSLSCNRCDTMYDRTRNDWL